MKIQPGDVVQMDPDIGLENRGGAYLYVTHVRMGAVGGVFVHAGHVVDGTPRMASGEVIVAHEAQVTRIGPSPWQFPDQTEAVERSLKAWLTAASETGLELVMSIFEAMGMSAEHISELKEQIRALLNAETVRVVRREGLQRPTFHVDDDGTVTYHVGGKGDELAEKLVLHVTRLRLRRELINKLVPASSLTDDEEGE